MQFICNGIRYIFCLTFQCEERCCRTGSDFQDVGDKVPHVLAHFFTNRRAEDIRKMVVDTLDQHPELTISYALPWVEHKGSSLDEWQRFTLQLGNKFDKLALYICDASETCLCYLASSRTMNLHLGSDCRLIGTQCDACYGTEL